MESDIEIIASKGKLSGEDLKKQFKNDIEKYRKLLDKMISDINIFGERYGEEFIKIKKRDTIERQSDNYSKGIGFKKSNNSKK